MQYICRYLASDAAGACRVLTKLRSASRYRGAECRCAVDGHALHRHALRGVGSGNSANVDTAGGGAGRVTVLLVRQCLNVRPDTAH